MGVGGIWENKGKIKTCHVCYQKEMSWFHGWNMLIQEIVELLYSTISKWICSNAHCRCWAVPPCPPFLGHVTGQLHERICSSTFSLHQLPHRHGNTRTRQTQSDHLKTEKRSSRSLKFILFWQLHKRQTRKHHIFSASNVPSHWNTALEKDILWHCCLSMFSKG